MKLDTFLRILTKLYTYTTALKHEVFVLSHTPKISFTVSRVLSSLSNQVKKRNFFFKRTTTPRKRRREERTHLNVCYFLP